MAPDMSISRQRVPMIDASILEGRTRPTGSSGSFAARLRYFQQLASSAGMDRLPSHQPLPTQARLGRR